MDREPDAIPPSRLRRILRRWRQSFPLNKSRRIVPQLSFRACEESPAQRYRGADPNVPASPGDPSQAQDDGWGGDTTRWSSRSGSPTSSEAPRTKTLPLPLCSARSAQGSVHVELSYGRKGGAISAALRDPWSRWTTQSGQATRNDDWGVAWSGNIPGAGPP